MNPSTEVLSLIPQKPPFLFVDEIIGRTHDSIMTSYHVSGDEYFFAGHFPGNPIMPAVIMQEALFQSAALLLSSFPGEGLGVVSKVSDGKFKKMVRPGDILQMKVIIEEQLENAFYMKGNIELSGKTIVVLTFVVAKVGANR